MSNFNVSFQDGTVRVAGYLDEEAQFPQLDLPSGQDVPIDMNDVKSVNSVGIRSWLSWITPLAEGRTFVFMNVPQPVVLQMNMIEGFLPKGSRVETFYAPVYSEEKDEESHLLLKVGQDVAVEGGAVKININIENAMGGGDWELDVLEKSYFKFLLP